MHVSGGKLPAGKVTGRGWMCILPDFLPRLCTGHVHNFSGVIPRRRPDVVKMWIKRRVYALNKGVATKRLDNVVQMWITFAPGYPHKQRLSSLPARDITNSYRRGAKHPLPADEQTAIVITLFNTWPRAGNEAARENRLEQQSAHGREWSSVVPGRM
jgi:hypothetical protein